MRTVERFTIPPTGFESEGLEFLAGRQWDVDNAKSKRELGVEFRLLAEGLRDYLPWELDQLEMDKRIEQSAPSREVAAETGQCIPITLGLYRF